MTKKQMAVEIMSVEAKVKEKHFENMLTDYPHVLSCDMHSTYVVADVFYTNPGAADEMGMTITPFASWGVRVFQFRERRELRQMLKLLKRFDPLVEEIKPGPVFPHERQSK